jgi:LCP family protein required for cell wall assembly
MADDRNDEDPPDYNVYRSRPQLLRRRGQDEDGLGPASEQPEYEVHGKRRGFRLPGLPRRRGGGGRRRISVGRVLRWAAAAVATWVLVSLVVFLISAQIQSSKISDAASAQLTGGKFPLTSPNTILVLGSDARPKGSKEAGATTVGGGPSRSDSILLLRIGGGKNATLSILRDTVVDIPGHGRQKINAAYAFGGPSLAIKTVEGYLGIPINHLVEVNFENFPQLIDSLGGITYTGDCVISKINGGSRNGGYTLSLKRGTHEIDGKQALALARTRHNICRPKEDDRARVRRQQKILSAIKGKVISLETFVRLPWVSWAAPKAVRSDMSGPSLLGLVGAELIGGNGSKDVLKPSGAETLPDGGQGLTVDDATKREAVQKFLAG